MSVNLSTASAPLIIVTDDHRGTRHLIRNILARDGFAISMRPPSLDDLGLVAVLNNMVNELSRHTSIKAELNTTGTYITLPVEVETALYRCIQETLTNAARHSYAGKVVVKLDFNNDKVIVRVTDVGMGFDMGVGGVVAGRLGLKGMKERVALLDGDIEINSSLGNGTDIFITIPLSGYQKR